MKYFHHGMEPWLHAGLQCLVQTFTAQPCITGQIRHTSDARHLADRVKQLILIARMQE